MSSVDQRDAEFALSFFSVAGSAGLFMVSLFVACALAFLIRIIKSEPFETRAFITRTAICWVALLVLSPVFAMGALSLIWKHVAGTGCVNC